MANNKVTYYRKGNVIRESLGKGKYKDHKFPSINAAKRESRSIQLRRGILGNGVLQVVDKFPRYA